MIGVFDSGVGGLCALRELRARLPEADLLYFGDTRNLPYGGREPWEILALGRRAMHLLSSRGAGAILSACGTVSSVALPALRRETALPLYGILEPLVAATRRACPRGGTVVLLATEATMKAGRLSAMLAEVPGATVIPLACPSFVEMAEAGVWDTAAIAEILSPLAGLCPQAVVLGCTHFSRLAAEIAHLFPGAAIIDGAREAARATAAALPPGETRGGGRCEIFTSGNPAAFARAAAAILGQAVPVGCF